jgi:glycosyltransferase involved in cell wall biosynthesis
MDALSRNVSADCGSRGVLGERRVPPAQGAVAQTVDVLLCMYGGLPEPPTLNAIGVINSHFRSVTFLRNNLICPPESYPVMPKMVEIGRACDVRKAQIKGKLWKLSRFIRYCWAMNKHLRRQRYGLVVLHDHLALLAFWLVRRSAGYTGLTWFNSYDAIDLQNVQPGRFSLMRLVVAKHESLFAELDFFSLPSVERKPYYPIHKVKRDCFVIPNFPAVAFYRNFYQPKMIAGEIKLIYQGALGRGHGFENLIRFLRFNVREKPLHLTLKGWITEDYRSELLQLAAQSGVSDKLSFAGFGSYRSVPELASTATIGLAIFTGHDIMNQTLGTASNKIYEYAALGLPVILFDSPHFRHHLNHRQWAYFTDLTEPSLEKTIGRIVDNYEETSRGALHDFLYELNFERVFTPALHRVIEVMAKG